MIILGIETSCDETAVAVVEANGGLQDPEFNLLGSAIHSQIEMHREFGGVVPNLAKREHIKNLPIVLAEALKNGGMEISKIDMIAVTVGPGLEPALWTGIKFAEELSQKYNIPLIPTNHMEGHIASVLLGNPKSEASNPKDLEFRVSSFGFPAIALLVSGGHTELVLMQDWRNKKLIGETLDDAVGEAFDKVARMLGLPYPGGPEISALAEQARNSKSEIRNIKLPRPMINSGDYNFSFSGLKTAVLYYLRDNPEANKPEVAREFEDAVCEVLISKSKKAILEFQPKTFIIGGGVIANNKIRAEFEKLINEEFPDIKLLIPEKSLATDNACMIAMAGYLAYLSGEKLELKAKGNLKIS